MKAEQERTNQYSWKIHSVRNSEHYGRQNEQRNPEKARESRNYFYLEYFFHSFSQKILGRKMTMGSDDFLKAADEAFALLDVDGNGTIERGDIE